MRGVLKHINIDILIFIVIIGLIFLSFKDWSSDKETETRDTMNQWAEKLDKKIKPSGDSTKRKSNTVAEKDAWGTPLQVDYKNDGGAQLLLVKSAGKDKLWETKDDLVVSKKQINAKGTEAGKKERTAEIAKKATTGTSEEREDEAPQTNTSTTRIKKTSSAAKKKTIGPRKSATYNLLATDQSSN